MSALREAAQQALEALESSRVFVTSREKIKHPEGTEWYDERIAALRAALKQEAEAAAWLAERKDHWRKEREKAQAAKDQDPELSAALGWPGGISDPVLDRTQLLQMVAALMQDKLWEDHRVKHLWDHAQEQAGPAQLLPCPTPKMCEQHCCGGWCGPRAEPVQEQAEPLNLSDRAVQKRLAAQWGYVPAALAESKPLEPDIAKIVSDNLGKLYVEDPAEPVQEPVARVMISSNVPGRIDEMDVLKALPRGEHLLYTAPPRRTMVPLTDEEIDRIHLHLSSTVGSSYKTVARAIEKASWEKNHGQA